jgi:hypothetical protein
LWNIYIGKFDLWWLKYLYINYLNWYIEMRKPE